MIDERVNQKYTDKSKFQIGFDIPIKLPNCCILCGSEEFNFKQVVGLEASMLEGSITESGSQFPLCDNCYSAYEGRRARLNKFMVVSFVLGLIGFVSLFPLGIEEHGYNSPVIVVMCLVNSVLIIASSIFLKMKGRAFPIRFESKLVGLMSTKRVSVFNCPNVEVYDRFMRAEMVDDD